MKTGDKIRALRLLLGYDQKDLAFALSLNAPTSVNRWEQGVALPRIGMLQRLGKVLQVSWAWLQHSHMPVSSENFLRFRPLSPYLDNTERWTRFMCTRLPELFIDLCNELNVTEYFVLDAPCQGGITIAANNELAIEVSSLPELHAAVRAKLPQYVVMQVANDEYLEELCTGSRTAELFSRCGIDWIHVQQREPEPPASPSISMSLNAKIADKDCCTEIKSKVHSVFDELIQKYSLFDVSLNISIIPSRSENELICDLIEDKRLKKLAQLLFGKKVRI